MFGDQGVAWAEHSDPELPLAAEVVVGAARSACRARTAGARSSSTRGVHVDAGPTDSHAPGHRTGPLTAANCNSKPPCGSVTSLSAAGVQSPAALRRARELRRHYARVSEPCLRVLLIERCNLPGRPDHGDYLIGRDPQRFRNLIERDSLHSALMPPSLTTRRCSSSSEFKMRRVPTPHVYVTESHSLARESREDAPEPPSR